MAHSCNPNALGVTRETAASPGQHGLQSKTLFPKTKEKNYQVGRRMYGISTGITEVTHEGDVSLPVYVS